MKPITVKSVLQEIRDLYPIQSVDVTVWQDPIKEIDSCPDPVRRYFGELDVCLESGQNFLDYGVYDSRCIVHQDQIRVVIKALPSQAQIENTISAYRS